MYIQDTSSRQNGGNPNDAIGDMQKAGAAFNVFQQQQQMTSGRDNILRNKPQPQQLVNQKDIDQFYSAASAQNTITSR